MPHLRTQGRLSRAEQQQATRQALIYAALESFTQVGYHRASLDQIARQAGVSKGAVYSNFANKAELFLAVMDLNIAAFRQADVNPLEMTGDIDPRIELAPGVRAADLWRGFGLATLEFLTTAVRDVSLAEQLRKRVQHMIDGYAELAATERVPEDVLTVDQLAGLMAALDQGSAFWSSAVLRQLTALPCGLVCVGSWARPRLAIRLGQPLARRCPWWPRSM